MKNTFAFLSTLFIIYLYFFIIGLWFILYVIYNLFKNMILSGVQHIKKYLKI